MTKKRRKLDQFLSERKKRQELVLSEQSQLSNHIFRAVVVGLVVLFLAVLAAPARQAQAVGVVVLLFLLTGLGALCLNRVHPEVLERTSSFYKFILLLLLVVGSYELVIFLEWSPFLVPLPMFAMVVALAYSQGMAILTVLMFGLFIGLASPRLEGGVAAGGNQGAAAPDLGFPFTVNIDFPLAVVLTAGAITSVLGVKRVRKQSKPVVVGFNAGIVQAVLILALALMGPAFRLEWLMDPARLKVILTAPGWGFAGGLISGAIVTCLLPAIEKFFEILTERRLLDLVDPSSEILECLRQRAPGTYQHTLGVALLAENAAQSIGGDPLLARVGTMYHDIGKIVKPEYFVENMGEDKSIHDRLRPSMSKMIIMSHVKDGIDLANEAKLPQRIIDMIPMHHGTTVVEYFYQKARREIGQSDETPGEVEYRYPGPKPRFREAGILMLADAVEAIAKTEAEPNPSRFRAMVHDQILKRLLDGQLDESDLTLNDLRVIEESFARTLTTMYHNRIKYPTGDGGTGESPGGRGVIRDTPAAASLRNSAAV